MIKSSQDGAELELQSVESLYKQQNQFNSMTELKGQDPKFVIKIGQTNDKMAALPP